MTTTRSSCVEFMSRSVGKSILGAALVLAVARGVAADDVPYWRGQGHHGIYAEQGTRSTWPEGGPAQQWKTPGVGAGYSSPVVVGRRVYVTGYKERDGQRVEMLSCLDRDTGGVLWQSDYGQAWSKDYPSSRSTPTFSKGEIFAISGAGEVAKLDAASGALLWKVNAKKLYKGVNGGWGSAESPLVDDRAVYFTAGGALTTMVALNRLDGSALWQSRSFNDKASYVSPTEIIHNGQRQIVGATTNMLFGIKPESGELAWSCNFAQILDGGRTIKRYDIIANSIVYRDGRLLLSNGYGHGTAMFKLNDDANAVETLWTNQDLCSQHHGFVWLGNVIYGASHNRKWTCVDAATGRTLFSQRVPQLGQAQVIAVDGRLLVYDSERGNVILAKAETGALAEICRFAIRDGEQQHWCHPVVAGGVLYLRRGDVAMAYDLK